jgi:hypothetical protein
VRELRHDERVQLMSLASPVFEVMPERDALWDHCRNALGIARLLVQEGRPTPLVATACQMAVESACRAGLSQAGLPFDGDASRALTTLAAPTDLWDVPLRAPAAERLAAAQGVVAWVAGYLRSEAPDRAWGF